MRQPLNWPVLEKWGVILVALHSFLLSIFMMFFPRWTMQFAGWDNLECFFFVKQSGAFHFVVALGYVLEYWRHRSINLLIVAKATAMIFLLAFCSWGDAWAIPFSGATDGLMLVGMLAVHQLTKRSS